MMPLKTPDKISKRLDFKAWNKFLEPTDQDEEEQDKPRKIEDAEVAAEDTNKEDSRLITVIKAEW